MTQGRKGYNGKPHRGNLYGNSYMVSVKSRNLSDQAFRACDEVDMEVAERLNELLEKANENSNKIYKHHKDKKN